MGLAARALGLVVLTGSMAVPCAAEVDRSIVGHIKVQLLSTTFPEGSAFRETLGSVSLSQNLDARVNFALRHDGWDYRLDAQLIGLHGDNVEVIQEFSPELKILFGQIPQDRTRLMDLTYVIEDSERLVALGRLDRLSFGYSWQKGVIRAGRQAITWGNGLIYNPMDIFNPFDPAAVDKEYKFGDDMIYGQYLWNSGDDIQAVAVFRRDPVTGDVTVDAGSLGAKYHGLAGRGEYDVLVAQDFGDAILGFGGNLGIGGAVWSSDLTVTFTESETVALFVTGATYSWTWGGKNVSGAFEYFFNGFGQPAGEYDPDSLATNPELLRRIGRGELFTLGRHYLATSILFEITPLFLLTPNLFVNVADPSALLQVVTQTDLGHDLVLLGALNVPMGADGTEFGGIPTEIPGLYLSSGPGIFVQLAWYF